MMYDDVCMYVCPRQQCEIRKNLKSYLVVDNQLCTNPFVITASPNQERNVLSFYSKRSRSKSSFGSVSLNFPGFGILGRAVLITSNPPVSLLIGRLSSVSSCRVITIGRLVVKGCTSPVPVND